MKRIKKQAAFASSDEVAASAHLDGKGNNARVIAQVKKWNLEGKKQTCSLQKLNEKDFPTIPWTPMKKRKYLVMKKQQNGFQC